MSQTPHSHTPESIWPTLCEEALLASQQQPLMASFFHSNILSHESFACAIRFYLSHLLATKEISAMVIGQLFEHAMTDTPQIEQHMRQDLYAHYCRDAACHHFITPFLYFKGFHALQSYRIAHWLWQHKRKLLAHYLQSRISTLFDVDIHPGAHIAGGIMLDHATGLVIGETTIIEQDVSMLHAVTLGGSGALACQRHPTIRRGVLLSTGAKVLGNTTIGESAVIGAGSVVLEDVPPGSTAVGVPAKVVGRSHSAIPALGTVDAYSEKASS